MQLTLGQVARELGMNKATLSRYIKQGKVSAEKQQDGSYRIDPSEIDRLRTMVHVVSQGEPMVTPYATLGEIALLRELLAEKDKAMAAKDAVIEEKDRTIRNLAQERDEWRDQCKKQLLLLSAPKDATPAALQKKRWWRR